MFMGGNSGGDWGPERPSRSKKIPVKISNRRFMAYYALFFTLFILLLIVITLLEMAGKTQAQTLF